MTPPLSSPPPPQNHADAFTTLEGDHLDDFVFEDREARIHHIWTFQQGQCIGSNPISSTLLKASRGDSFDHGATSHRKGSDPEFFVQTEAEALNGELFRYSKTIKASPKSELHEITPLPQASEQMQKKSWGIGAFLACFCSCKRDDAL